MNLLILSNIGLLDWERFAFIRFGEDLHYFCYVQSWGFIFAQNMQKNTEFSSWFCVGAWNLEALRDARLVHWSVTQIKVRDALWKQLVVRCFLPKGDARNCCCIERGCHRPERPTWGLLGRDIKHLAESILNNPAKWSLVSSFYRTAWNQWYVLST